MRRGLALLGAGLVVAGAVLAAAPDRASTLSSAVTPSILAVLGLAVALVGAAVAAGPSAAESSAAKPSATESPAAESSAAEQPTTSGDESDSASAATDANLLGAEFDATLARIETMSAVELRRSDAPDEIRERLRSAAVATVVARDGVDTETAAEIVERGAWTDDPVAAAFLSSTLRAPLAVRCRELTSATPRAVSRARRTVAALEGSR